jgi:hypothetical protein
MNKRYRVRLTADERAELVQLLARGKADIRKLRHARMLMKADESDEGPGWPDARLAEAVDVGVATIARVRRGLLEEGLASALRPHRGGKRLYTRKLDSAAEAHLLALACSPPPEGRGRWTLPLLARRMVERADVDRLSHEAVRRTLKKARPASAPPVVHSRQALGRVRPWHGGRARGLSPAL